VHYRPSLCHWWPVSSNPGIPKWNNRALEATKHQLQLLADQQKGRANHAASEAGENDKEEMALLEEIKGFALEDMGKMLMVFDRNHPLIIVVSSVKDLRFNS